MEYIEKAASYVGFSKKESIKKRAKSVFIEEELEVVELLKNSENLPSINIKCVMLGDGSAGKSYASTKFATGILRDDYVPTVFNTEYKNILVDRETKTVLDTNFKVGQKIHLEMSDTAGQDGYETLLKTSCQNTNVALIAVDLTSQETLENAKSKWVPLAKQYMPSCQFVIGGMKNDLWDPNKIETHISQQQLANFANQLNAEVVSCSSFK